MFPALLMNFKNIQCLPLMIVALQMQNPLVLLTTGKHKGRGCSLFPEQHKALLYFYFCFYPWAQVGSVQSEGQPLACAPPELLSRTKQQKAPGHCWSLHSQISAPHCSSHLQPMRLIHLFLPQVLVITSWESRPLMQLQILARISIWRIARIRIWNWK